MATEKPTVLIERGAVSGEAMCREYVRLNRETIRIKKEERAVRNLVRITNAALKLSQRKGFQNMTLRDLCRESGLSMGALYTYFRSKDELLNMILDQGRYLIVRVLRGKIEQVSSPQENLRAAIRAHLILSERMRKWFEFFFHESRYLKKRHQKKTAETEKETEELFTEILLAGMSDGVFRSRDATLTAAMIKALMQDWYLKRWKYAERDTGADEYADAVIEMVEAFVLAR